MKLNELKHDMVDSYIEWGWISPDGKWMNGLESKKFANHREMVNGNYVMAFKLGCIRYFTIKNMNDGFTFGAEFAPSNVTEVALEKMIRVIKQLNHIQKLDAFFLDPIRLTAKSYENIGGKDFNSIGRVQEYILDLIEKKNVVNKKYFAKMTKKAGR